MNKVNQEIRDLESDTNPYLKFNDKERITHSMLNDAYGQKNGANIVYATKEKAMQVAYRINELRKSSCYEIDKRRTKQCKVFVTRVIDHATRKIELPLTEEEIKKNEILVAEGKKEKKNTETLLTKKYVVGWLVS